jgi:hypothetical protein
VRQVPLLGLFLCAGSATVACGGDAADPFTAGTGGQPGTGGAGGTPMGSATGGAAGTAIGPGPVEVSGTGGAGSTPPDLSHTFAPLHIAPGQELTSVCQSWTVGNETPLHVNRVVATNRGGVHHSNWIWVPENQYAGPDGTWPCADRGFDQILAGASGGVFFAQSTQSLTDTQAFPPGVAFEMPARVRIIGDVHLLNTGLGELQTDIRVEVFTLPPEDVVIPLQPMAFTNLALDIAPSAQTEAFMQCAVPQTDFDVYYVLPHYHELGTGMRLAVAGGSMNGTPIFDSGSAYGEPWGRGYDPPFAVRGAAGLGISCFYENPRSERVGYGTGDQEMCVTLLYTSGRKAGGMATLNLSVSDVGGVHRTDGLCLAVGQ